MPKDRFYKSPPTIPGRIYKNNMPKSLKLLILIPLFLLFLYWAVETSSIDDRFLESLPSNIKASGLVAFILLLSIIATFFSSSLLYVDVTQNHVTAKFENGADIKKDEIKNYAIFISKPPSRTNSYRYKVSLVKIDNDPSNDKHFSLSIKTYRLGRFLFNTNQPVGMFTLADYIYTPTNLKEWIESFQSQINAPLFLAFQSPDLKSDYETGVYRSLENKTR